MNKEAAWATNAAAETGAATAWADDHVGWKFEATSAEDGTPYLGAFAPDPAPSDLYAFHVVHVGSRFGVGGSAGEDVGVFDTLGEALDAGAAHTEECGVLENA